MSTPSRYVSITASLGGLAATGEGVRVSARAPARGGAADSHDSIAGRSAIFRKAVGL